MLLEIINLKFVGGSMQFEMSFIRQRTFFRITFAIRKIRPPSESNEKSILCGNQRKLSTRLKLQTKNISIEI